jgi:uncharacterized protein (DUF1697 family)
VPASHVAFLRGINVGRAKRVAMADLRALVAKLGYRDVKTLLNSGNVVFSAPATARDDPGPRIEQALVAKLAVSSRVTVLTARELQAAVHENPLASTSRDPSRLQVVMLARPADRKHIAPLAGQDWSPEALALGTRVAYLWCPDGVIASRLHEAIARLLGDAITARNWATMQKLLALAKA